MAFERIFSYNNNLTQIITEEPESPNIDAKSLLLSGMINNEQNIQVNKEIIKETVFEFNNISYPIIADSNKINVLAESIYIGNQFFLSIIDTLLFNDIYKYPNSYSLLINNNTKLRITQMQKSAEVFDNTKCLVIFKIIDYEFSNTIVKQEIINYNDFIYMERLSLNCKVINNYSIQNNGKISNIIDNSIIISIQDKINQGSPLIIDNKVIGLFYKNKSNDAYYLRLSRITYWLCNFITIPYNVPIHYSNQELYNVILSLSDKVQEFENKLNEINSNNQIINKKIEPLIYTLISSDQ
jgi:hypothetical protein